MLVPPGRHDDWIFSTLAGHLQLLLSISLDVSRLLLIGPFPSSAFPAAFARSSDADLALLQDALRPFLQALCPNLMPLFLSFDDDALVGVFPIEVAVGPVVGDMVVEDVLFDCSPAPLERRRRLRFKRLPLLIQSQVRLLCTDDPSMAFSTEIGSLVQPYLAPMVASLALIGPIVDDRVCSGLKPRVLCCGIGGGALPMALRFRLGFEVVGLESDATVVSIARRHFGLVEDEFLRVFIADATEMIQCLSVGDDPSAKFDAAMVDLDSGDAVSGVSAPPLDFISRHILVAMRSVLREDGILVLNVIPPSDTAFYEGLVNELRVVFSELYELDAQNGENYVLVGSVSPARKTTTGYQQSSFLVKLRDVVGSWIDAIKKL